MKLPMLRHDLANHFVVGSILASIGACHSVLAGLVLCASAAVLWEIYQRISKTGTPSALDALYTVAGSVPVLVPLTVWRITS